MRVLHMSTPKIIILVILECVSLFVIFRLWTRKGKASLLSRCVGRATGNVFVVKREPSGRLITTQLPSLGPDTLVVGAMRYIRQAMSNDPVIAGVRLLERE